MTLHSSLHPGISRIHGSGIIALADIPLGTALWAPCPRCRVMDTSSQRTAPPAVIDWLHEYGYRRADAGLLTPCHGAHLFNHSCRPAVLDLGLSVGIAVADIRQGEEVCCDYRTFRFDEPWAFACSCGTPVCEGVVESSRRRIPDRLAQEWRTRIGAALEAAGRVPQEIMIRAGDINGREGRESA
ncbi:MULTISPECIES: SET domain-containing protein-lysine N-methyltransferase [unclassified Streptomyces]|uniref:SET domain-containing protein-lysine N-methyltransferase n=1 Tax=unclassified Streptomyces TaxID=2593676 RepID=UPI003320270E